MLRRPVSKLLTLDCRHPGLRQKVYAMFDDLWTTRDVRQMLHAQFGEHVSLSCLEKYKARHRQEQRQMALEMSQRVGPASDRAIGRAGDGAN